MQWAYVQIGQKDIVDVYADKRHHKQLKTIDGTLHTATWALSFVSVSVSKILSQFVLHLLF